MGLLNVTRVFQGLLLLSPICVGAMIDMDMFDIIFFRIGVAVLFMASLFDYPKRVFPYDLKKILFTLLALCLWNTCNSAFANPQIGNFLNIFLAVYVFYMVYCYWDKSKSFKKYILIAVGINAGFLIIQKLGFDPIWDIPVYKGQEGALLGNGPRFATYFALVLPLLPTYLTLILGVVFVKLTNQYAIFIPLAVILIFKPKSISGRMIIGLMVLTGMVLLRERLFQSLVFRFNMAWKPILCEFFNKPLLGFGLGQRGIPELEVVGSSYLQFIVSVGVLGVVWFGYVFKSIYKKIRNNPESIALVSLALLMTVEYPIEIRRLWFTIIAILTMFLIKSEVKDVIQ